VSIRAMNRVIENSRAEGADFVVLLMIANFANEYGKAWPSNATLARTARVSERQTRQSIGVLHEELKEIDVAYNAGPNRVNVYHVLCFEDTPITATRQDLPGQNVQGAEHDTQFAPNPSGTLKEPEPGPGPEFADAHVPALEEVLNFAERYVGNLALGIPAKMPSKWARRWYEGKQGYQKFNWANWKRVMVLGFENDFTDDKGAARENLPTNAPASGNGEIDREMLEERVLQARHRGDKQEEQQLLKKLGGVV